ncbi:MAG: MBL fold metallo-hydrolase [Blautia sp.]
MKLTVLIENQSSDNLCGEHGLSLAIDYKKKHYLLDTGASGTFTANAEKLGISLSEVDTAFLSHGHYDHSGGYEAFFEINKKANVYAKEQVQEACYSGSDSSRHYIGIPEDLIQKYGNRFVFVKEDCEIQPGIWLISHKSTDLSKRGMRVHMYRKKNNTFFPDDFAHEQSLVFEAEEGLILLNSCSHGGIETIVKDVNQALYPKKVFAVIGGFHLKGASGLDSLGVPEEEVLQMGTSLLEMGVKQIYTGHCTGFPAYELLKESCGSCVHYLRTGTVIEFTEKG